MKQKCQTSSGSSFLNVKFFFVLFHSTLYMCEFWTVGQTKKQLEDSRSEKL